MNEIMFGDCRDSLRQMAADGVKVQTCVTSPPYFGLRNYGADGQIGLEDTPEQYIAELVEVFRCVRDVLADDGTLWVNIADSYNSGSQPNKWDAKSAFNATITDDGKKYAGHRAAIKGLKHKDLIGIPWMLAFALRADGWFLRQEIIWHKPNPMPESATDRCTKAHESLFLLAKSPRYFCDMDAVKEPSVGRTDVGKMNRIGRVNEGGEWKSGKLEKKTTRNRRSVWTIATKSYKGAHFAVFPPALVEPCILAGSRPGNVVLDPFMGSGTTAAVAIEHGRQYIGCELNTDYKPLQDERIALAHAKLAAPPKIKGFRTRAAPPIDLRQQEMFA